jgi:hypothetical protein
MVKPVAPMDMSAERCAGDNTCMENCIYQAVHGRVVVNLHGRPCVLDTGLPVSLGRYPISIAGREFEVYEDYLGVSCEYLSAELGTDIEAIIGADIISEFTLCVYSREKMVQFLSAPTVGNIVLPVRHFMNVPIIRLAVNGELLSAYFDTGSPLSYLRADAFSGLQAEARQEEFYPLVGNFLTRVYPLPISIGGAHKTLRFGELPAELECLLEAGQVQAIVGTELLSHFGVCLSLRDGVMRLELPFSHRDSSDQRVHGA